MTASHSPPRPSIGGYSLIEVLTALILIGILSSLAAPSLQGLVAGGKARGALDRITADVAYARMGAVRSGRATWVRFRDGGEYLVVQSNPTDPSSPTVLRQVKLAADYPGVVVSWPSGMDSVLFDTRGMLRNGALGTVRIRAAVSGRADSLMISPVGRVYREY